MNFMMGHTAQMVWPVHLYLHYTRMDILYVSVSLLLGDSMLYGAFNKGQC